MANGMALQRTPAQWHFTVSADLWTDQWLDGLFANPVLLTQCDLAITERNGAVDVALSCLVDPALYRSICQELKSRSDISNLSYGHIAS